MPKLGCQIQLSLIKLNLQTMKRILCLALFLGSFISLSAQADSTVYEKFQKKTEESSDTAWKFGGNFGIQLTQAAYSNWQAGGANSVSANGLFNVFANYDKGGDWRWSNSLIAAYGLNFQDGVTIKTDDRLEIESRLDRKLGKNWNASGLLNFRTQFTDGFANPEDTVKISTFLAPAYTLLGLGFTYTPNKKFSAFLSPVTGKLTIVNDQDLANAGAFGVDAYDSLTNTLGQKTRWELGAYASVKYKTPLAENIELQLNADFFMNYLQDDFYQLIDVNAGMVLFMKVNKYITANLTLNMIYDDDIIFEAETANDVAGPRTQFKQVLGVGFSYNFGEKAKK